VKFLIMMTPPFPKTFSTLPKAATVVISPALATIQRYYDQIDALDYDQVLERFAPKAEYHREGWPPLVGKPSIAHFFKHQRQLRGVHAVTGMHATQPSEPSPVHANTITVHGTFTGHQAGKPINLTFKDRWQLNDQHQVMFRQSWISIPGV
jgi:steroid Delta-isomerase